jgi:tRNA A37 threonylcarbamoyladenosine synthetase subunit TsaC/SUA5/YrdC
MSSAPTTRPPGALAEAREVLRGGGAVVLPNPHPLTSVVAATAPEVVNGAKGRPADQSVALWIVDDERWAEFAVHTALDAPARDLARRLLVEELVTLLVPVGEHPPWIAPATRDGKTLLFGARWTALRPVFDGVGRLHVSSANRTGQAPVASAAQAREVFPADVHVLDLDDGRPAAGRRATTTLQLRADRSLTHVRDGAQDHVHGGPSAYLAHLAEKYPLC